MFVDQVDADTISQFEDLFGKPPLLEGEDAERYRRLCTEVIRELKPKSFSDFINAKDQIDKIWEEQRYKRTSAALIDSAYVDALAILLGPIYQGKMTLITANKAALQFYGTDPKAKKEVAAVMAENGITDAKIQARAAQMVAASLQLFDRMIINREASRRLLRKENEHRLSNAESIPATSDKSIDS